MVVQLKADHPTPAVYEHAAWFLMCETAALQAVGEVEAGPQGAFTSSGVPTILFERHKFSQFTDRRYDGIAMDGPALDLEHLIISAPRAGGYGPYSIQHDKLAFAEKLDREAAMKSCSWGLFQVMGFNHARVGFPNLQRFLNAMFRHVDDHLRAMVMYVRTDQDMVDAIRRHEWGTFARLYNGTDYRRNRYDEKMAAAYVKFMQDA